MDLKFLDFEQPIGEVEAKIDELKFVGDDSELNISEEISRLRRKSDALTKSIFSKLSAWQIAQLARHPHDGAATSGQFGSESHRGIDIFISSRPEYVGSARRRSRRHLRALVNKFIHTA